MSSSAPDATTPGLIAQSVVDHAGLSPAGSARGSLGRAQSYAAGRKRSDLSCCYCQRLFSKPEHLKRHEDTHKGKRQHNCKLCHKTFGRPDSLKRHEKTHVRRLSHISFDEMSFIGESSETIDLSASMKLNAQPVNVSEISLSDRAASVSQQEFQVGDEAIQSEDLIPFPVEYAWPGAADILEILMNADAGWPMDVQMPLLDMNGTGTFDTCHNQSGTGEGSFARARQAMQHMSNLMQDLSFNLATEVESAGISSEYLDVCMNAFFERFVIIFPVVHQPTFSLKDCASPLLLNMIVLGSLFCATNETSNKVGYSNAEVLWRLAHAAVATSVSPTHLIEGFRANGRQWQSMLDQVNSVDMKTGVQLVMTALLGQTHAFLSQSRSTRNTSHTFHGLGFYWARQCEMSVSQSFSDVPTISSSSALKRRKWEAWAAQETRHRALLGHYILDGLISQFSGLPTSDRHVTNAMILPSSGIAYEALSADGWIQAMEQNPQSSMTFRQIYLDLFDSNIGFNYELSYFSVRVVLEGLQSLISDHRQAQGDFVGAKDLRAIDGALWRLLDTQIEGPVHSSHEKLDLLIRWHAICIERCVNTNILARHLCESYTIEQDLYNNKSCSDFDTLAWAETIEARRAILHASAIADLVMNLSLRRVPSIHIPFAVATSSSIFLAMLSCGYTGAGVPSVIHWRSVCLYDTNTRVDLAASRPVDIFLDLSHNIWNPATSSRNFLYNLNSLQAVLGSLSLTWGIAKEMNVLIHRLICSMI
ncbi:C2H2 type zinc finger domain protein [Aureobasidium subglaciale]|nr:C2H2 type zinc finger domain protein [Aureobasidium subglaciale]KAI5213643.1 C2H2 type zinc finger domain protein [Aureobasidium subglaciale]KAI5215380.1 C2H2 type zinc finger domain protein [Aureobasidium subglaciale]KAI5253291.1 C2H2 type zinc finger domain protein [Aureobasidium subglaciale]